MSCGRRPKLIAAILANISYHKPFIHTPPKSLFTKRRGTFWEPDPGSYRQHRAPGLSHAERAANRAILRKVLADGASEADAIASLSPEEKGFAKSKRAKAERKSKLIKTELLR